VTNKLEDLELEDLELEALELEAQIDSEALSAQHLHHPYPIDTGDFQIDS